MKKYTDEQKKDIITQYESGISSSLIAEIYKVSSVAIISALKRWGIERRHRRYLLNESFFDIIDCEVKAYFLGLLYADGCVKVKSSGYGATLCLQIGDEHILQQFKSALNYSGPILYKKPQRGGFIGGREIGGGPQASLSVASKKLALRLVELGCIPKKSFTLTFPEWMPDALLPHFVRGYIDGDGWITFTGVSVCYIGAIGSIAFIEKLAQTLNRICGVSYRIVSKARTEGIISVTVGGRDQVSTVLAWLYKNAAIYLDRKKRKAEMVLQPVYHEGRTHGDNCYRSILTESKVREIQELLINGKLSMPEIARRYEVKKSVICHIAYGSAWSKVTGWTVNYNIFQATKKVSSKKLTEASVVEIRALINQGVSNSEIASKYGVKREQIRRIGTGERWGNVVEQIVSEYAQ